MTIDEVIRAFSYFMIFPAFTFFSLIFWNQKQRVISIAYGALATFFALMMLGLVLGGFRAENISFLYVNTVVVIILAIAVTYRATMIVWSVINICVERAIRIQESD